MTIKVLSLSAAKVLASSTGIILAMVSARFLTKADYATVRQTFLAYDFVATLLVLGLPTALYFYLPRSQNDQRGIFIDNLSILFLTGTLFSIFLLLGGTALLALRFDNPNLSKTLEWLIIYPIIAVPVAGVSAALVTSERIRELAIYNVATAGISATVMSVAIVASQSFAWPILAKITCAAVYLPVGLYLVYRALDGPLRWPNIRNMAQTIKYAVPIGLATIMGSITLQLHSLIVASLCTTEEFAIYINGAIELPLVGVVTGSITTVILAEMSTLCANNQKLSALKLFRLAGVKSAAILFPATVFFLISGRDFIILLYTEEYSKSFEPFAIYLFVLPVRIVVYGAALMALGMGRSILIRSGIELILNAILSAYLVSVFGYIGAAIATVLTLYIFTVPFNLRQISKGFEVSWKSCLPFADLGKILACSIVGGLALYIAYAVLVEWAIILKLAFGAILFGSVVGSCLWWVGLMPIVPRWLRR